jgi:pyruvate dehydrogenase E2 component (dihydrolipoamide acetyltransferase)
MPIEILMPALSPTMTEGNLAKWLKKEGDPVKAGDVIAEIETDKATMEVEAVDEGALGKILVPEGSQGIKVNQPIAVLLEEGEDASAIRDAAAAPKAALQGEPATPAPQAEPAAPAPRAEPGAAAAPAPRPGGRPAQGERIFASPLARRMAEQAGIDLAAVKGSGPGGRIVKADIEAALAGRAAAPEAPRAAALPPAPTQAPALGKDQVAALAGNPPYELLPLSSMRRTIARRLTEAKQQVPHFYLTIDCVIDRLLELRAELEKRGAEGMKLSVNDFVIKAAALALRKVPAANASWSEDGILRWQSIDICVAVAIEDGLITPIVKNADQKGLAQISAEMKDLAERARAGKLKLAEFQGGTFSISNLGMYGVKQFEAVINPPQGCILAVGRGEQRPVVRDGALAVATVMSCTLSVDHRVVDGATAAQFLAEFKTLVEEPLTMLL